MYLASEVKIKRKRIDVKNSICLYSPIQNMKQENEKPCTTFFNTCQRLKVIPHTVLALWCFMYPSLDFNKSVKCENTVFKVFNHQV